MAAGGGRFDFDDGGTYCGGWLDGKAHGHGVCTGPKGQGAYCGAWQDGFETSGVYAWPSGGGCYEGQWGEGRQTGLGVETKGRWVFRGEWTLGLKGRYGTRQSIATVAKYDGTWANGLQDGYGSETYADGGTFQGQWVKGMRHGYGVRSSAPFGLAAHTRRQSLRNKSSQVEGDASSTLDRRPEEGRGGFVLRDSRALGTPNSPDKRAHFKGFLSKRTKRGGDRVATIYEEDEEGDDEGGTSDEGSANSFVGGDEDEPLDSNVIETYMGEWKNDRRSGFGIAERSDGLKYEGEWHNNKKFGYGRTTYKDGVVERGKYRHNVLLSERRNLFRSPKFRERLEAAVNGAHRASQIALQKADIAISRTATARGKAEQADAVAKQARADAEIARLVAKNFAPEFQQPGLVQGSGFLKPKFPSSHDSSELLHRHEEDKSFLNHILPDHQANNNYLSPEPPPPSGSAFLDLFRNNPDRRPSAAGFLRRPSTLHLRRPSTVVEHSIVPSQFDHHPAAAFLHHHQVHRYPEGSPNYQQDPYHQNYHHQQVYQVSLQQVIDDHLRHYYDILPNCTKKKKKPAIDLTELSQIYGIPLTRPLMDDDDAPLVPQGRRSTLPTVIDQLAPPPPDDGMVRTGSLYTRKNNEAAAAKASSVVGARKKSLPDISSIPASGLSREAIAVLSSQRREAIRREEEEAIRLRQNPLLYLVSPEVWDWFASQQLVILIIVINLALGFIFFNVIL